MVQERRLPNLGEMSGVRQLRVVGRNGHHAVVLAPTDSKRTDTPLAVHRESLVSCLGGLEDPIDAVVFVDGDHLDDTTLAQIEEMVDSLAGDEALVLVSPVSDAVKVVHEGVILRGLDRSKLFVAIPPAVVRRTALERALGRSAKEWINPVTLVALFGGSVSPFPRTKL